MNQGQILLDTFFSSRQLTWFYFNKLKDGKTDTEVPLGAVTLNSPRWILAHLAWSQNMLLLKCLGLESRDTPWLDSVRIGSEKISADRLPSVEEILQEIDEINELCRRQIPALSAEELAVDNVSPFGFGNDRSKRMMMQHAIRHEATHSGHLGLICKYYDIETV